MLNTTQNSEPFFYVLQDSLRVLFVDDDPILREFALVHLSAENTAIDVMADGLEALAHIEHSHPDVILLDLEMPKMDGFEFLQHLRTNPAHAHTPVIVCTGREDVRAVDRAFQAGATSFVVKPINWRLLSYQIRYVMRAGRSENSPALEETRAGASSTTTLMALAQESSRFLSLAVEKHPDLKPEAEDCARGLQTAMQAHMKRAAG